MQVTQVKFIAVDKDGKAQHGSTIIATASSRGTNCALREMAENGIAVVSYQPKQAKLNASDIEPHVKAIAETLEGSPDEKTAVCNYLLEVLTTANVFKSEKIVK